MKKAFLFALWVIIVLSVFFGLPILAIILKSAWSILCMAGWAGFVIYFTTKSDDIGYSTGDY